MPHQCTGCGRAFADGSKEMLSGCPSCGGNTFQFRPPGSEVPEDADPPSPPAGVEESDRSVAETVGRATTRVRDFVSTGPDGPDPSNTDAPDPDATWPDETSADTGAHDTDADIIDADARRELREDDAQASARTDLASADDVRVPTDRGPADGAATDTSPEPTAESTDAAGDTVATSPAGGPPTGDDATVVEEPSDGDPDLAELREQLNDQFESIRIVEPGEYELNLMELYDREEYIIALQENGRYVIQVPDQWIGEDLDDR